MTEFGETKPETIKNELEDMDNLIGDLFGQRQRLEEVTNRIVDPEPAKDAAAPGTVAGEPRSVQDRLRAANKALRELLLRTSNVHGRLEARLG